MGKIPEHAKRVFKGEIFDVYQWEQELFDGSMATYEMLKRTNTLNVIATKGDKLLYCKQEQSGKGSFLSLFGGRQEEDESPQEGIKREFLEETGMQSDDWELLQTVDVTGKIEWMIYTFIARDCKVVQEQHLDPGEKIEVVECSFEEFYEITQREDFREKGVATMLYRLYQEGEIEAFKQKLFA